MARACAQRPKAKKILAAKRGLDDASVMVMIRREIPAGRRGFNAECLNVAENRIGDRGVAKLIDYLIENQVHVADLRLYKNELGDAACC